MRRATPQRPAARIGLLVLLGLAAGACVTVEAPENSLLDAGSALEALDEAAELASTVGTQAGDSVVGTQPEDPVVQTLPPTSAATPGTAPDSTPTSAPAATDSTATTAPGSPDTTAASDLSEPKELPGEPYEYGPAAGTLLGVVGVRYDDALNVRDIPFGEVIATLSVYPLSNREARGPWVQVAHSPEPMEAYESHPISPEHFRVSGPNAEAYASLVESGTGQLFESWDVNIVATGNTRKLPTTVWHEISVGPLRGWASAAYLAPDAGFISDVTAEVVEVLGGAPVTATLREMAMLVGRAMATTEPESRVVVSIGPGWVEGDSDVGVDVLNIGDDSVLGFRYFLVADAAGDPMTERGVEAAGPFTLRSATRTVLCYAHRGVSAAGYCR